MHRNDMALTPCPVSTRYGFGLFDHPHALFSVDFSIITASMLYYAATTKPTDRNLLGKRLLVFGTLFAAMQAAFSSLEMPGKQARWVHAPLMLVQLLEVVGALEVVERRGNRELGEMVTQEKGAAVSPGKGGTWRSRLEEEVGLGGGDSTGDLGFVGRIENNEHGFGSVT